MHHRSADFRPSFSCIHEIRAFVASGTPILAATATATVTDEIRKDVIEKLDMVGCDIVYTSPDRPNIFYAVKERTTIDEDLQFVINDLKINNIRSTRVVVYCRSLNMCSALYHPQSLLNFPTHWKGLVVLTSTDCTSVVALSLHTSQHQCGFLLPSVLATDLPK